MREKRFFVEGYGQVKSQKWPKSLPFWQVRSLLGEALLFAVFDQHVDAFGTVVGCQLQRCGFERREDFVEGR
jgi:hypothetical protein